MRHLGLDMGATYIKWVVLDGDEIAAEGRLETRAAAGPDAVIDRLVAAGNDARPVDTVGIGVPGLYEASSGTTTFLTNMPGGWRGVRVVARLSDALGAPAALINDARAFALAESQLGAARERGTAVFVAIGTGVGGGLTIGGALYEGREGRAGEIGHVTIAAAWKRSYARPSLSGRSGAPANCSGSGSRTRSCCSRRSVSSSAEASAHSARSCSSRCAQSCGGAYSSRSRSTSCRRSWASWQAPSVLRYAAPAVASAAFRALKSSRIVPVAVAPIRVTPTFITSSSASSVRTPPAAFT